MRITCFLKRNFFFLMRVIYVVRIAIVDLGKQECFPEFCNLFAIGKSFTCLMA